MPPTNYDDVDDNATVLQDAPTDKSEGVFITFYVDSTHSYSLASTEGVPRKQLSMPPSSTLESDSPPAKPYSVYTAREKWFIVAVTAFAALFR